MPKLHQILPSWGKITGRRGTVTKCLESFINNGRSANRSACCQGGRQTCAHHHSVKMSPFPWSIDATGTQDAGLQCPSTCGNKCRNEYASVFVLFLALNQTKLQRNKTQHQRVGCDHLTAL